jgi:hypothetical protein
MFDVNLALRVTADGALSADEVAPGSYDKDFGGPDRLPLTYVIRVPSAGGTTPTLDAEVRECSTTDGTFTPRLKFPQITAAGVYYAKAIFRQRFRGRYLDVGGTTPNFGIVTINVAFGSDYDQI